MAVPHTAPSESARPPATASPRSMAIDVLRGFSILWVLAFHAWADVKYGNAPRAYPPETLRALGSRVSSGDLAAVPGALLDAVMSAGHLGVPLFMMLSGLSLTMGALRRDASARDAWRDTPRRLRKVMIPYWAGFVYAMTFYVVVALVQTQRHPERGFISWFSSGPVHVDLGNSLAGALLWPRLLDNHWQYAPMGALWFVFLLVQYYVLLPALLAVIRRFGPWTFLAAVLAVQTLAVMALVIGGDPREVPRFAAMVAPFRFFEFALGMVLGYMIVVRPEALARLRRLQPTAFVVPAGLSMFVLGCMTIHFPLIGPPLICGGMALVAARLIAGPLPFATTVPVRALAAAGVVSYAMLIVNDPLRVVTEIVAGENGTGAATLWLVALCFPLTFVLARPVAIVLGLVERPRPAVSRDPVELPAQAPYVSRSA